MATFTRNNRGRFSKKSKSKSLKRNARGRWHNARGRFTKKAVSAKRPRNARGRFSKKSNKPRNMRGRFLGFF